MSTSPQVIIVGAGPVGLFLSCELASAGVSLLVIERDAEPVSIWKTQPLGRRGLQPPSVQAFYRRGLLAEIKPPLGAAGMEYMMKRAETFIGHFAGIMLERKNLIEDCFPYHIPGPAYVPVITSLEILEKALTDRAQQLGVTIKRGVQATSICDDGDSVTVTSSSGESFTAPWLVGCDGGRSFVRKAAGIAFEGTGPEFTGYNTIAEINCPDLLKSGMHFTPYGLYINPSKDSYSIVDFDLSFDRSQPVTREHFESVLRKHMQVDVKVNKLVVAGTYTARCCQAVQYRKGRILLAGDAAHIHSPLGGQGLNAGIGDAINLGWKLAATVKNCAADDLLDTYHLERHPVGATVLEWTRAQVATLRPDGCARAVQKVIKGMSETRDGTTWMTGKIWGIDTRYDFMAEEKEIQHDIIGRDAPDIIFDDGQRLGEKLQSVGCRFVVLDLGNDDKLANLVKELKADEQVRYVAGKTSNTFGLRCMVLRPDGVVSWVGRENEEVNSVALMAALKNWIVL